MFGKVSLPTSFTRLLILAFAALPAFLCVVACSPGAQAQQWTLENGKVARTLAFDDQLGLYTKSWRDLDSQVDLTPEKDAHNSSCREFQVKVNDQIITGSSREMTLVGTPVVIKHGEDESLEITLAARTVPLRVVIHYQVAASFAGVRQWLTLENIGEKPLTLHSLTVACYIVDPGPRKDIIAFRHYGEEPSETFFTGRIDDVAPLIENARTGEGFAVLSEVPSYLRRTEIGYYGWTHEIRVMYDNDLFPYERSLAPSEKLETAASSIVFYRRGTARDPHWILPQYVEKVIAHNKNEIQPEWIYNNWEPWAGRITEAQLTPILSRAVTMGLTLNTLDDGWEKTFGENTINLAHFPNGLDPVFESKNGSTLKRGLWFPVALVAHDASVYREHPEWVCRGRDGKPKESQGQGVVMCMDTPYKQTVLDRIVSAVERYKLDYIKLDLTTVVNAYGEEPGCYETNHEHASTQEFAVRSYEALNWLGDKIHERFPHLLVDYTFELWGAKHLIDYGLLHVADLDWMINVDDRVVVDAGPLQARAVLYQRGISIPTEDMIIGNLLGNLPPWQDRVATAMASAPVFLGDLSKLSEQDAKDASGWITRFRKLRTEVRLQESFFPLGAWRQPRVNEWDGYARFAKTGEGLVVIFKNDSVDSSAKIVIPGFPEGTFDVTDWQSGAHISVEGQSLREGWQIPLASKPHVLILEVRKRS